MKQIVPRAIGVACLLLVGCTSNPRNSSTTNESVRANAQSPEMVQLSCFVGEWKGTGRIAFPPEDQLPPEMQDAPPMEGVDSSRFLLGGHLLERQGRYIMGEQTVSYRAYWMWSGAEQRYKIWFANELGGSGEGTARWTFGGDVLEMRMTEYDAEGKRKTGLGEMRFPTKDRIEWRWTEFNALRPGRNIRIEGVTTRR